MTVRQIEVVDRLLGAWARKVFPYAQQRDTEGLVMLVDLDVGAGASLLVAPPQEVAESMRFCYPGKLATSVRGRLKRLAQGASPAELSLGHDLSTDQAVRLLSHLDAHWYQIKPAREAQRLTVEMCAGGVAGAPTSASGGRTFDRKDPLGRLSYQNSQHLATLGALTDYDRFREQAERTLPWERWQGRYEWREASLVRVGGSTHRWFLEQLVTLRDDERTRLGYVTRIALDSDGTLAANVRLWAGSPRTMAVRSLQSAFSEDPPMPLVELRRVPGRARLADRPIADVRARPAAALDELGAGAALQAHQAAAARRRLRARRLRRDRLTRQRCPEFPEAPACARRAG